MIKNINYLLIIIFVFITINTINVINSIIPINYIIVYLIIILVLLAIYILSIKKNKKIICLLFSILLIGISSVQIYAVNKVEVLNDFIEVITNDQRTKDAYDIITLNENNDIDIQTIGIFNSKRDTFSQAIVELTQKYSAKIVEYDSYDELFDALVNEEVNYIFANNGEWDIIIYESEPRRDKIKIIDTITIETDLEENDRDFEITEEPFIVYLSGIDSSMDAMVNTRSDVNIILAINPTTKEITSVNIPRDTYVYFPSHDDYDKLTHAGVYGVTESMNAIEYLLDIKIDFYVRVNFDAVIDLVDAIDGITIYSEYSFTSHSYKYTYTKGYNHLDGKEALEYSRERKNIPGGDQQRGENQQAVIDAIISKVSQSTTLLTSYEKILNSLEGNVYTNMEIDDIKKLINMQLNTLSAYEYTTYGITGTDSSKDTLLSAGYTYVMLPNETDIEIAKNNINKIFYSN